MQRASFNIINYQFRKFILNLDNLENQEFKIKFETSGVYVSENKTFELKFQAIIFNGDNQNTPIIDATCIGVFQFENIEHFEEIPEFFYRNSIAILFPYLRAYISIVTTQANLSGIILPTYNLSSLEEDLRKSTLSK